MDTLTALAEYLNCTRKKLARELADNPRKREKVTKFLKKHDIMVTYKKRRAPIRFEGLTPHRTCNLYFGGRRRRKYVTCHFLAKYNIRLHHVSLPCAMEKRDRRRHSFIPLELTWLRPKRRSSRTTLSDRLSKLTL